MIRALGTLQPPSVTLELRLADDGPEKNGTAAGVLGPHVNGLGPDALLPWWCPITRIHVGGVGELVDLSAIRAKRASLGIEKDIQAP